jgi:ABC-2 type transport system ATP-binding protein
MPDAILVAKELNKAYGDLTAVKNVSFSIERGEIFSLLGPNGAGKTTAISILSCLIPPTSGEAWIGGHSVLSDSLAVKRLIGVVPQELALYEPLTARQNLTFWGRMYGMDGKLLNLRVAEILKQVSLEDRADDRVEKYSGGMKRRLNLAIGLLNKPELVFMDEPTVGIDPQNRRNILDMVKELRDQGMTVLYTTHYMEEAAELSDRVGIIDHGELIAMGTLKELILQVGERETLRLQFSESEGGKQTGDALASIFCAITGVDTCTTDDNQVLLTVKDAEEVLPAVLAATNQTGLRVRSIDIQEPNLEAVFLHLTGRALRD